MMHYRDEMPPAMASYITPPHNVGATICTVIHQLPLVGPCPDLRSFSEPDVTMF